MKILKLLNLIFQKLIKITKQKKELLEKNECNKNLRKELQNFNENIKINYQESNIINNISLNNQEKSNY